MDTDHVTANLREGCNTGVEFAHQKLFMIQALEGHDPENERAGLRREEVRFLLQGVVCVCVCVGGERAGGARRSERRYVSPALLFTR